MPSSASGGSTKARTDVGLDRHHRAMGTKRRSVAPKTPRRRWRFYETRAGRRPVREFLDSLSDADAATVAQEMRDVARVGLAEARHLRGDVYEVRAEGDRQAFRVLFAPEGRSGQVLLALEAFSKKTQRTPKQVLELAERRLRDWRQRGRR